MLFHLVRNEYLQSQLINICNVNNPSLDNGSIFQRYIEITERNAAVNSFAVNVPENKVFFLCVVMKKSGLMILKIILNLQIVKLNWKDYQKLELV